MSRFYKIVIQLGMDVMDKEVLMKYTGELFGHLEIFVLILNSRILTILSLQAIILRF